ncbi:Ribonuclease H-like domain containing protein [Parasponia andersonii]|uniref:Ribonuclease H-like domain containing protein n=1 Tax=Parasponia andersonii TaxID=3476 RepID=A0A2P5CXP5_PARAD|nr:Ribonuclease H-like domain containing protein [Parasponia andersonii]
MDMSKNIPIDLELDDDQISIAEEGDQVPEIQTNPNASGSCSQFQDSCSPSASTTSKRAMIISNVWDHFDPEFKDEADDSDIDLNDENFKVLEWWHKRQTRFPVLSQLARDVLIIPVSTIFSESAFSTTKMIVDEWRTSLAPEMVQPGGPTGPGRASPITPKARDGRVGLGWPAHFATSKCILAL